MALDRSTLVFFDASCVIAAAGSATGASASVMRLCRRGWLRGSVSEAVLIEADRNIAERFGYQTLQRYFRLLQQTPLLIIALRGGWNHDLYAGFVGAKDAHVIAAAVLARADYLLTFDAALRQGANRANLAFKATTPTDFVRSELPQHVDYDQIRLG